MALLIYQDVFISAIKDMESFYSESYNFKINHKFNDNGRSHASIVGKNEMSFIRFSKDCCQAEVLDIVDLIVALVIISHELAHYVNHHNYYSSDEDENNRIIEAWADRFGMSILMTMLTYGEMISKHCIKLKIPKNSGDRINLIGKALGRMVQQFYNNESDKYHFRIERLMHACAGVGSFLQSYWGQCKLNTLIDTYLRLHMHSGMESLIEVDFNDYPISNDDFDKIIEIHYPLQEGRKAITMGLKRKYRRLIDTSFVSTIDDAIAYRIIYYGSAIAKSQVENTPDNVKVFLKEKYTELLSEKNLNAIFNT